MKTEIIVMISGAIVTLLSLFITVRAYFQKVGTQTIGNIRLNSFTIHRLDKKRVLLFISAAIGLIFIFIALTLPQGLFSQIIITSGTCFLITSCLSGLFSYSSDNEISYSLGAQINEMKSEVISNLNDMKVFHDSGLLSVYPDRKSALLQFQKSIEMEQNKIMIVTSSLKGFFYGDLSNILNKLHMKVQQGTYVRFLLTHPAVADLRANQENRALSEIGHEIIDSINLLSKWGVPPANVKLYMGSPIFFAIVTSSSMLVNFYPYTREAYHAPSFIFKAGSLYEKFYNDSVDAWNSQVSVSFDDYEKTIYELKKSLKSYSDKIIQLTKGSSAQQQN